jgi:P-type Cu2+ transporter
MRPERSEPGAAACHHCGLPVASGSAFGFEAGGQWRTFCCAGCEGVSRSITELDLGDYYRLRAAPPQRPPAGEADFSAYDAPDVQARFVRTSASGGEEAELVVEGMRCAACAWLVEQATGRAAGVREVQVDFASRRARVRWDRTVAPLSSVLAALQRVGYRAWPYEQGRVEQVERGEKRDLLRRLAIAALGMMQVMMYAWPAYVAAEGEVTADVMGLMHWAALVLTLPVLLYSAAPFFRGAWRDLRVGHAGMDVPIALGVGAAYVASAWNTASGTGPVYFDSVTMFVFLLLGSRYLEMLARARAADSLRHLARLVPRQALRLARGSENLGERVALASLAVGDRVLVRPGESVPADGVLESAAAEVNEAWMSGESRTLARVRGDKVLAGSINSGSGFVLAVEHAAGDTQLAAIHRLIDRAAAERPPAVDAAQRAARIFVKGVLVAAALAALAWSALDPSRAPWIAVAVLIVTCPCALALAVPAALTAARGRLARRGVVITRGRALEGLAGATHVVFDKTGTLTEGKPLLLQTLVFASQREREALALAGALARASSHPLDHALVAAAAGLPDVEAASVISHAGAGLEAQVGGRAVRLGRADFVAALHRRPVPVSWLDSPDTTVWLGDATGWIGAFRLGDRIRAEAAGAVAALRRMGLEVCLLTGDAQPVAQRVADALGIASFCARCDPAAKREYVEAMRGFGARVLMVGDGINDAPVLAGADVSIAMGGGADLAQLRADAVLLSDSLLDLVEAVRTGRRTRRVVRQNLAWALGYNLVAIPLAVVGVVTPLVAAIGMSLSSLVVVANALRLRR